MSHEQALQSNKMINATNGRSSSSVQAHRSRTSCHQHVRICHRHSSTAVSSLRQARLLRCQSTRSNATATTATATATAAATIASPTTPSPLGHQLLLKDPAEIGARGTATASVRELGGDLSVQTYMTLPVEQYYILDPSKVQFLEGNRFILSVPRLQLLGASLQPVIEVQVRSEPDAVVLEATDCKLNATGIMGGLDSKFALRFSTRLTWSSQQQQQQLLPASSSSSTSTAQQQQQQQQQQSSWTSVVNGSLPSILQLSRGSNRSNSSPRSPAAAAAAATLPGSITGTAVVQVWCEVVPPFHLMPKSVLENSCNSVLTGLVNSLLPWFMRQLAADYQKWAADADYRAARRSRSTRIYMEN
jgi:hypothetical protein